MTSAVVLGTATSSEGEALRVAALHRFVRLDGLPDPALHATAALAREAFRAQGAAVSVVDEARQWILAEDGPVVLPPGVTRACSPCAAAIDADSVLVMSDLAEDPRFRNGPLVRAGVRFYAGAPLRTPDGQRIGTVCVLSEEPRLEGLSAADLDRLDRLADVAMASLEMRLLRRLVAEEAAAPLVPPFVVPTVLADHPKPERPRAARPGRPALAAEIVARIRALRQTGRTMAEIAAKLGVAVSSVHKVLKAVPQAGTMATWRA